MSSSDCRQCYGAVAVTYLYLACFLVVSKLHYHLDKPCRAAECIHEQENAVVILAAVSHSGGIKSHYWTVGLLHSQVTTRDSER